MSFLSRIWVNPRRSQSQRFLRDRQALHAAVLAGIPHQPVTERVLWRIDTDQPHRPALMVLTRSRPSWEHLVEQAGWPGASDPDDPQSLVREYQPLLDRLRAGESFAFRVTANPVRASRAPENPTAAQKARAEDDGPRRSVILGHRTVDQQIEWLTKRAEGWGFTIPPSSASTAVGESVPDLRVTARDRVSFRRGRSGPPVTLQVVTYEGRLTVQEPSTLREALLSGMGRAKAYGCGLMTLAPLSSPSA